VKLVKTIMGMWLIQELRKDWQREGLNCGYDFLTERAEAAEPFARMIDVDSSLFKAPEDIGGGRQSMNTAEIIRRSFDVKKYEPKDKAVWDRMYKTYQGITQGEK